jgi:hypothetical protein
MTLVIVLKEEGPDTMLNLFDGESDTPELIWNSSMRGELRIVLAKQLDVCVEKRRVNEAGDESFSLQPEVRVKYNNLEDELFVGGVYVSRFLKEPTYNIRDPTAFLEMLLQRWTHELKVSTSQEQGSTNVSSTALAFGAKDALQSVTDASVYLCKVRTNLCDKLSQWGYMGRCLAFLEDILSRQLLGTPLLSVMRVLHVAVHRRKNTEALIISGQNDRLYGIVPFTKQAIGADELHPDTAFIIDLLKRLFIETLGDVNEVTKSNASPSLHASQMYAMAPSPASGEHPVLGRNLLASYNHVNSLTYAVAPSPAPGEGPVSRNPVSMGNPLDDPLAFATYPVATSNQTTPGLTGQRSVSAPPQQGNYASSQVNSNMMRGSPGVSNLNNNHYSSQQQSAAMPVSQTPLGYGYSQSGYPVGNQPILSAIAPLNSQLLPGGQVQFSHQPQPSYSEGTLAGQGYQKQSNFTPAPTGASRFHQPYASLLQNSQYAPINSTLQQGVAVPQSKHQLKNSVGNVKYGETSFPQEQPISQTQHQESNHGSASAQFIPGQTSYHQQQQQHQHLGGIPQSQQPAMPQYPQDQVSNTFSPGQQTPSQQSYLPVPPPRSQIAPQAQQPVSSVQHQQVFTGTSQTNFSSGIPQPPQQQLRDQASRGAVQESLGIYQSQRQVIPSYSYSYPNSNTIHPNTIAYASNQSFGRESTQVESVEEKIPSSEGSGVDVRTTIDPKEEAEMKMKTVPGAPGAADGRIALLQSALICDLPKFLVEDVLENPKLSNVKDSAATKVHSVELLKLLTCDPGYGMKFQMTLDSIPSWKKYKAQDHSLFITGPERTTVDYFLTDGSDSRDPKKLLTQG